MEILTKNRKTQYNENTLLINPETIQESAMRDTKEPNFIVFDCETKKMNAQNLKCG